LITTPQEILNLAPHPKCRTEVIGRRGRCRQVEGLCGNGEEAARFVGAS